MLRRALLAGTLLLAVVSCGEPEGPYPGHAEVLARAFEYDVYEASRLRRTAAESGDPERIFVAALASYLMDSSRYASHFIEAFPPARVMTLVYERIEKPRLTPSHLYSIAELGRIALEGHAGAVRKLHETLAHAEPPVTPVLCDAWIQVLDAQTDAALRGLDELAKDAREPVYACLGALGAERAQALATSLRRNGGAAPVIEKELARRLADRATSAS